jgi:hypothetical protein
MIRKTLLSLFGIAALAVSSSYAHLGLTKTECDALYNQFPERSDMPNGYVYNLQGVTISLIFSPITKKAVSISYYAPAGLNEKFVSILAGKNGVDWTNLVATPKEDSWLAKNKLSEKRPPVDELYSPDNKNTHVTVTEKKQYIDIVTSEGEEILSKYWDEQAQKALKDF